MFNYDLTRSPLCRMSSITTKHSRSDISVNPIMKDGPSFSLSGVLLYLEVVNELLIPDPGL